MQFPMNITFHNTRRTQRAEDLVMEHAERLSKFFGRIQACEVVIDRPHHHHNKGNTYEVRILISLPGQKVAVSTKSSRREDHTILNVALRDGFESARRQLQHTVDKMKERRKARPAKEAAPEEAPGSLPATA
jgi:ribosome-associated translation inhibitor RaiA